LELEKYHEMEESWQSQRSSKAEMENDFRLAKQQITSLEKEKIEQDERVTNLEQDLASLGADRESQEEELQTIREQRDEQERREIALTNRLNAAKKKEGVKANLADHFEDEMSALRDEATNYKDQLEELTENKTKLEDELSRLIRTSQAQIKRAELALSDERRLNEDRKAKMKGFIENKSEELRQAKADADSMQVDLNQTSKSLVDLNNRWKQLHAQWVQSQTRNRELQRDLNRIKKDSETLHKVGDTLEMKLSRSATETEEHKHKRVAAKNELMTVLRALESEREVSARLRDAIKFTFTPKALSQQQLLKENLEDFESELIRLSRQFGKPIPPVSGGGIDPSDRSASDGGDEGIIEETGNGSRSDADTQRLIGKLDHESQVTSQYIMALTGEIEKLHMLIDVSASSCYSSLSGLLLGNSSAPTGSEDAGANQAATSPLRLGAIRSHQYGQLPRSAAT
jgi:chromosome segregation ATPase